MAGPGALEAALAAQRAVMDRYGEPLEQLLSVLVYLVPVDVEGDATGFWSQAACSVTDLFNLYRTVLLRSPEALPVAGRAPRRLRLEYTCAAFLLRALRSVQVLIEMLALRRAGPRAALRVCARVEAAKLALKLVLRARMPFAFYVDEEALEEAEPKLAAFVGPRSGRTLRALGAGLTGGSRASVQIRVAEALFHARPLAHPLLLLRRGRGSWGAWLLALLLDWLSLSLLLPCCRPRPGTRAAALEQAELRRRRGLLWWALARSPLYDAAFRRPCEALDRQMKRLPLVNLFNVVELALALQPLYFATSAS